MNVHGVYSVNMQCFQLTTRFCAGSAWAFLFGLVGTHDIDLKGGKTDCGTDVGTVSSRYLILRRDGIDCTSCLFCVCLLTNIKHRIPFASWSSIRFSFTTSKIICFYWSLFYCANTLRGLFKKSTDTCS